MANELVHIIEDNEVNRVLVRDMLRFKGYQTLEAPTGEDGIRVAREKQPALILMDFHLPKMNGIEAFEALRADPQTRSIPPDGVRPQPMLGSHPGEDPRRSANALDSGDRGNGVGDARGS